MRTFIALELPGTFKGGVYMAGHSRGGMMTFRHQPFESLKSGANSNAYNLGNGNGFSVKEVVETVEKVVGKPVKREIVPRRAGDPAVLVASSDKIKKELGWKPEYDSLEKIVASAWKWHSTHPDGFKTK